jgi:hypothetical protein
MMHYHPQVTCVIDPTLALTQYGLSITRQLAQEVELWIAREFWHILDNPTFYLQHLELVVPSKIGAAQYPEKECSNLEETLRSLKEWEQFRRKNHLAGLNLFWLGDSPKESFLPSNRTLDIFWHWESIARSLDHYIELDRTKGNTIPLFVRDTIALAASLDSTLILTHRRLTDIEQDLPPQMCQILEQWKISCQEIRFNDSMVELERNALHSLLVQTNTAKFLWSGVHLAVIHLLTSVNPEINKEFNLMSANLNSRLEDLNLNVELKGFLSMSIRGFWYSL